MVEGAVGSTNMGTYSDSSNPLFTFVTSTVFTIASRELEYDSQTVRDGTADYR